jgi:hypothetical protein
MVFNDFVTYLDAHPDLFTAQWHCRRWSRRSIDHRAYRAGAWRFVVMSTTTPQPDAIIALLG